jgi:hypothetical protein
MTRRMVWSRPLRQGSGHKETQARVALQSFPILPRVKRSSPRLPLTMMRPPNRPHVMPATGKRNITLPRVSILEDR